jgi:hypothetical protein
MRLLLGNVIVMFTDCSRAYQDINYDHELNPPPFVINATVQSCLSLCICVLLILAFCLSAECIYTLRYVVFWRTLKYL